MDSKICHLVNRIVLEQKYDFNKLKIMFSLLLINILITTFIFFRDIFLIKVIFAAIFRSEF